MQSKLSVSALLTLAGAALPTLLLAAGARADFFDDYTYTPAGTAATTALPSSTYKFTVGATNTATLGTATVDGSTNLVINAGTGSAPFDSVVPSVTVQPGSVGTVWSISTTVSYNWAALTNPSQLYPSGGLTVFTDGTDYFDFYVKREVYTAGNSKDYFEVNFDDGGVNSAANTRFTSDYSNRQLNATGTSYTLTISKQVGTGNILLQYLGANFNSGALSTALTITPSGTATIGTGFSNPANGTPSYLDMYTFLNNLGSKQVGFFVDRQSEAANSYAMSVNSLSITGASVTVASAPEPGSLALLLGAGAFPLSIAARRKMRMA